MSQHDSALNLGARKWFVFPTDHPDLPVCAGVKTADHDPATCKKRGKHPAVKWDTGASTSYANISFWWSGNPRNIGIHCGKSGLLVIDDDGDGDFERFARDHGVEIPATYTVTTAAGKHYYFLDTENGALGNREGAFGDYAINVRSGRGYVIAAGSQHESGVTYTANGVADPVTLPTWVRDAIKGGRTATENSEPGEGEHETFELPDVIKEGHRDEVLYRLACSLRAQTLNYPTAKLFMEMAWKRCEQPPKAKDEYPWSAALAKLKSAYRNYDAGRSEGHEPKSEANPNGRWLDLAAYLDGTYTPPQANLGAERDDGIQLLYPGRWHTLVGLTTAGKTFFALWQAKAVMAADGHVIYIHFEEPDPAGTLQRLRDMGVSTDTLRRQFHWGDIHSPWRHGEMAREITRIADRPALAILDGILAACGQQGWQVKEPESVGEYRKMFVHPLVSEGVAVLSLGHPVKDKTRQGESYSYGAAGWLNDVDGVSYRMKASKTPITRGKSGSSSIHAVKDRYSEVQRWGELQTDNEMPWWYMGQFVVDDTRPGGMPQEIRVSVPAKNAEGAGRDKIDDLCDRIIVHLRETTGRFETVNWLDTALRAKGARFSKSDLAPALQRLVNQDEIEWPEVPDRKARPGWLSEESFNPKGDEQ